MTRKEQSQKATIQRLSNIIISRQAEIRHYRNLLMSIRDKLDKEIKSYNE